MPTNRIEGSSNIQPVQDNPLQKEVENHASVQPKGRPDIFKYDTKAPHPEANQQQTEETSFLKKLIPWGWKTPKEIKANSASLSNQTDTLSIQKIDAISPVPKLDEYPSISAEQAIVDPTLLNRLKTKEDFLTFFKSIKDFMVKLMVLMKEQLEIEGEQANLSDDLIKLFKKTEKSMDELYGKLRTDLEKEQNVAHYLGYAHAALAFATGTAAWFGYIPVLSAPAAIAGGADALTVAAKAYYDINAEKHKAEIADIEFNKTNARERARDCLTQLGTYYDNAFNVYATMAKLNKNHHRMKSIIIRK